jgi:hypothetical protein
MPPPTPVWVSSYWLFVLSRQPANDKSDNAMIPGAVHRSHGIYLTAQENPGKPQLGDPLMKAV